MRITIEGNVFEGTPEEIKEMMSLMGAEFPVKEAEETEETPKFKTGDRVKALANGEFHDIKVGEVGEITKLIEDDDDPYYIKVTTDDDYDYFRPQDLELVDESTNQPKQPTVGDIVVITANTTCSRNKVGDIGKVRKVSEYDAAVDVPERPDSSGSNGNYTSFDEMRHATPAEIKSYENAVAEAEQQAKWSAIGRKPNEYKKGDIVRATVDDVYKAGTIGVVTEIGERDLFRVEANGKTAGNWHVADIVELVTPAESRVDNV